MAFRERNMEKLKKSLESRCPDARTIQGVMYCNEFNTDCAEKKLGEGNTQIVKYNRPYGKYDTILLCDGVRP